MQEKDIPSTIYTVTILHGEVDIFARNDNNTYILMIAVLLSLQTCSFLENTPEDAQSFLDS